MTEQNLDILAIATELGKLLPQLHGFINNWNDTITLYGINVITDGSNDLAIDVPSSMKEADANLCAKKIKVLDSLIHDRLDTIKDLFQKGYKIESDIKSSNSKYVSVLTEKSLILKELNNSYKH
jgi:predicted GNAT superfamily acetyltransferase